MERRLALISPLKIHQNDCEDYIKECIQFGVETHGTSRIDEMPYDAWLQQVYKDLFGDVDYKTRVPATTFLVYHHAVLVGFVNIRHELNDFLLNYGGHIGYMIRPSQHNKGYGTEMLSLVLDYCKTALKLDKVLLATSPGNSASERVIIKNGGIYEDTRYSEIHGDSKRYWIKI